MGDMSAVIVPKSDQLNGEDLLAGPRTITITGVDIRTPNSEQPVTCHYEGEAGRPWKPCKTMSKLLVHVWGPNSKDYIGKSLTLFRDPTVKWGGAAVGGIRVSHMTDIPPDKLDSQGRCVASLMETRGKFKPHVIRQLTDIPAPGGKADPASKWTSAYIAKVAEIADSDALEAFVSEKAAKLAELESKRPDLHADCMASVDLRRSELSMSATDDFTDETPSYAAMIEKLKADIDAAGTLPDLDMLEQDFAPHREGLPEDVAADIDQRFLTMRRALERRS